MVIRDVFLFKHQHQFSPFEGSKGRCFSGYSEDISFCQVKSFKERIVNLMPATNPHIKMWGYYMIHPHPRVVMASFSPTFND
ncbi:hypothetical protein DYD21_20640 [Rhodohalobacter sp. SW132]|nr:hypothetical protein DYD21_20640 [Rhodohalobacter sp. SW132]